VDTSVEICSDPLKGNYISHRPERGKDKSGLRCFLVESPFGRRLEKKSKMEGAEEKEKKKPKGIYIS
jgi:hypothetical protein